MTTKVAKSSVAQAGCTHCGRAGREAIARLEAPILKGHVQRAIRAADGVYREALRPNGVEHGVVLMSAILLVERLARSSSCEPSVVLDYMLACFKVKSQLTETRKDRN